MNGVIKANTFENELRNKLIKLALLQQHKLYVQSQIFGKCFHLIVKQINVNILII